MSKFTKGELYGLSIAQSLGVASMSMAEEELLDTAKVIRSWADYVITGESDEFMKRLEAEAAETLAKMEKFYKPDTGSIH